MKLTPIALKIHHLHSPPPDVELQSFSFLRSYIKKGKIPWRKLSSWKREELCNKEQVTREEVGYRNNKPFPLKDHIFAPRPVFQQCVRKRFKEDIAKSSVYTLRDQHPDRSAARILSSTQGVLLLLLLCALAISIIKYPLSTLITANTFVTIYFILAIGYRFILMVFGATNPKSNNYITDLSNEQLPVITILLPLYRDKNALITLRNAIDQLDYPQEKKDVKLLLEEDDDETILEAKKLGLAGQYEIIIIPDSGPRTKPKACNFGMHLARGDLIVIFDAEDQPERDQLKKAASAFHNAGPDLACVQARLNYYNASENWLTRGIMAQITEEKNYSPKMLFTRISRFVTSEVNRWFALPRVA